MYKIIIQTNRLFSVLSLEFITSRIFVVVNRKTKAMDSIILEKQRRSDDKNKESSTDHVVTVSEASGKHCISKFY